ncbi:GL13369 [Drosophila persimilis]|uniref:GL13369 n=1 Tax=Drosophila persimilis TaxID=7234 RepID=B4H327_DROPE|nr:GL13369 [Drosophila persimilis]
MKDINTKSLKQELNSIQGAHQHIIKFVDDTIESIEQAKSWPQSATALNARNLKLSKDHQEAQLEEQALQMRIDSLGKERNVEDAFACIVKNLHNLGCTLMPIPDADCQTLYMFDFGGNRSVTVQCNGGHINLIDMSTPRKNFTEIKMFLNQSQYLMGLITTLGMDDQ